MRGKTSIDRLASALILMVMCTPAVTADIAITSPRSALHGPPGQPADHWDQAGWRLNMRETVTWTHTPEIQTVTIYLCEGTLVWQPFWSWTVTKVWIVAAQVPAGANGVGSYVMLPTKYDTVDWNGMTYTIALSEWHKWGDGYFWKMAWPEGYAPDYTPPVFGDPEPRGNPRYQVVVVEDTPQPNHCMSFSGPMIIGPYRETYPPRAVVDPPDVHTGDLCEVRSYVTGPANLNKYGVVLALYHSHADNEIPHLVCKEEWPNCQDGTPISTYGSYVWSQAVPGTRYQAGVFWGYDTHFSGGSGYYNISPRP